jgi:Pycsar effector protein
MDMDTQPEITEKAKETTKPRKRDRGNRVMLSMLRNEYGLMSQYFAQVERKSNNLIRLNSFIISGAVIIAELMRSLNEYELAVFSFLIVASAGSLLLAAFASRPQRNAEKNVFTAEGLPHTFFSNYQYRDLSFQQFDKAFQALRKNPSLVFESMSQQLYLTGTILIRKYRLLRLSYDLFLFGFSFTGLMLVVMKILARMGYIQ